MVGAAFLTALGSAIYSYQKLEWDAIWLVAGVRQDPAYVHRTPDHDGGKIADAFTDAANSLDETHPHKPEVARLAEEFDEARRERNDILHSHPFEGGLGRTRREAHGGGQVVFPLDATELVRLAQQFSDLSNRVSAMHRDHFELP
jgi:hypothetical protein